MDASRHPGAKNIDKADQATRRVALIGAPVQAGTQMRGCVMGPMALRTAGLPEQLTALGVEVTDCGDVRPGPRLAEGATGLKARNWDLVAAWTHILSDTVAAALEKEQCPIVLGGDHCLSIGSVNGVARHCREIGRDLFVLWLDAHADFNTPDTSPSGNLHGMSVAAFCGEAGLQGLFHHPEPVPPDHVHLFGVRSVDPGEKRLLRQRGVHVTDMRMIDEQGVSGLLQGILDRVAKRSGHLHVSLYVDFLDPALAPGVGTTVPGGATYREAHLVLEMLHDCGMVTSVDVAELNPFLDERGRTALLMTDLIASLFGRQVFDRPNMPLPAR